MNQKNRKQSNRKISGYTSTGILGMIALIIFLSLVVIPRVSIFKAKGQQSEARIKLVKVYNSMYAYKLENGNFIDTKNKNISILSLHELEPYLKEDLLHFSNKNDKIYLTSKHDQFVAAYVRILANGNFDIQRINSKKIFCSMLNGVEINSENCNLLQNYNRQSSIDEIIDIKKLSILGDD